MATGIPRILVVRNDKLGDFMLSWPALAHLRASLPQSLLTVLVPRYTEPLASACPWIDEVIVDPGAHAPPAERKALADELRDSRFDALLTLFSTFRVGWLGLRARIPLRIAPATKVAQVFHSVRVRQRRSRSLKPEYVYNLELAEELLRRLGAEPVLADPPYWPLSVDQRLAERAELATRLDLPPGDSWFFVHAGSGGSANNLGLAQYGRLAAEIQNRLAMGGRVAPRWVLTAGPGEEAHARELQALLVEAGLDTRMYRSDRGLLAFARSLAAADLFIAGSTGPLHVAGCLDVPTVGFFPSKRSSTALRWQPCNGEGRTLGIEPPPGGDGTDMSRIAPERAAAQIADFWDRLHPPP